MNKFLNFLANSARIRADFGLRPLSFAPYTLADFSAGPGCRGLQQNRGEPRARSVREGPQPGLEGGACVWRGSQWRAPWRDPQRGRLLVNDMVLEDPATFTTPLRLKVPAGVYTITYRHPSVGRTATKVAQVQAQKSVTSSASFPSLTSQDYLKRAGW